MDILTFILGLIIVAVLFITAIGIASMKYDSIKLENENKELKEKLRRKARKDMLKETKKNDKQYITVYLLGTNDYGSNTTYDSTC